MKNPMSALRWASFSRLCTDLLSLLPVFISLAPVPVGFRWITDWIFRWHLSCRRRKVMVPLLDTCLIFGYVLYTCGWELR
ncbi:unnamed protein product [Brassica rapa subsp. narinosa]